MKRMSAIACAGLMLALLSLSGCSMGGTHRNWGVTAFGPSELHRPALAVEPAEASPGMRRGMIVVVQQRTEGRWLRLRWFTVSPNASAIGG